MGSNKRDMLLLWGVGVGLVLFLGGGGMSSMGKGSSPSSASFSSSCDTSNEIGKWIVCSGRVLSIKRDPRGFLVEVRTHVGERVYLILDVWDASSFPIDSEVEFKVKGSDSNYFSEVQGVTPQTLEKYCTGVRWKRDTFENLELGRGVPIDISEHPELKEEGLKYVYIRGSSSSPSGYGIVSVELHNEVRGCQPGVNMLGE
jgi:hypothetical protein